MFSVQRGIGRALLLHLDRRVIASSAAMLGTVVLQRGLLVEGVTLWGVAGVGGGMVTLLHVLHVCNVVRGCRR